MSGNLPASGNLPVSGNTTAVELRIGDRERSDAVTFLRQQCSDGRLTLEEFSDRADLVLRARTQLELHAIVADLPVPPPAVAPPAGDAGKMRNWRVQLGVFSGQRQAGRWRPGRHNLAIAVFGSLTLDLREAVVPASEIAVHAFSVFGSIHVTVLEGTELDSSAIGVFGSVGGSVDPNDDIAPPLVVHLDGAAVFGSITTRTRATRAVERERKANRKAQRRAEREARRA